MGRKWGRQEVVNVYVEPEKKARWTEAALKRGFKRKSRENGGEPIPNVSAFVESVVEDAISGQKRVKGVSQSKEIDQLRAKVASQTQEIEALQRQNAELKTRAGGVAEDRILAILSDGKVKHRQEIVAQLVKTEDDAAYETLQRLMEKGIVKYVAARGGWGYQLTEKALKKPKLED